MEASMRATLPERIVACLLGLAGRIAAWVEAHPDAPLAEQEWAVLELVRASLPGLLEAVLLACTPGLGEPGLSARQPCPECGVGRRPHERRGRTVLTVCGAVTYERAYYYCRACKHGWAPADTALGLSPFQRLSERVRGWVGRWTWSGASARGRGAGSTGCARWSCWGTARSGSGTWRPTTSASGSRSSTSTTPPNTSGRWRTRSMAPGARPRGRGRRRA